MIPTINVEETGMRIDVLIHESEYSVRDISEKLGFETPQAVYKWMQGKTLPKLDNLVALAGILNVSIDDILVIE
jgi:transcriptional regulator with XRE-family HTH domain